MQYSFNANAAFFNQRPLKKLRSRFSVSAPLIGLCILFSAFVIFFSTYVVLMHRNYWTQAFDLGIFDQAIYLAGRFEDLFITVRGLNKFGDHFDPIIILLGQFYHIWNDVSCMLILHTLVIGLGAFPIYFFAKKKLENEWFALCFAGLYFCYPALLGMTLDVIHPEAFAMTFMIYGFYFVLQKKYLPFAIFGILAIFCKEDICITFIAIGVYLFFKEDKRVGLLVILGAVVYFILCMRVIIPFFSGSDFFRFRVGWFSEFYTNRFNFDWYVLTVFKPESIMYLFQLFFPLLFICFLDMPILLIAAPAIGINILSNVGYLRSVEWHYNSSAIPFIFFAAVAGFAKIQNTARLRIKTPSVLVLRGFPRVDFRFSYAIFLIVGAGLFYHFFISKMPITKMVSQADTFLYYANRAGEHPNAANEMIRLIPADAVVSADYTLLPHLSHRKKIYMFPNPFVSTNWGVQEENPDDPETIQYIAVSPSRVSDNQSVLDKLVASKEFVLVHSDMRQQVALYKRNEDVK